MCFSLTFEGNMCPGLGGEDVSFAKRELRGQLYSLRGMQEWPRTNSPYVGAFAATC